MVDFAKLVLAADTSQMKGAARDLDAVAVAGGRTAKMSAGLTVAVAAAAAATAALGLAAGLAAREFIQATIETEKVQAQLAAAIASTGSAAGRTIEQLNTSAMALQGLTTYGDEAINSMQALLLTFTRIEGAKFDEATEAVLNVATAMGTDLNSAALQVGKALNDPILGMTALSRSGIQFTEQQKDTVRALVETGDVAAAQTIILAELERQFGGSAVAARETLGGALESLRNSWGDLFELSGEASDDLRMSIEGLIDVVTDPAVVEAFQGIGSAIFNTMTAAIQAVTGLYDLFMDTRALLGFNDAQREVEATIQTANDAMDQQIRASGALATQGLEPGTRVSRAYALAQLDIAESSITAMDAMREQSRQMAMGSRAYNDLQADIELLNDAIANEEVLARMRQQTMSWEDQQADIAATEDAILGLRLQMIDAMLAQKDILDAAGETTETYDELVAEAARLREAIANGTGEVVEFGYGIKVAKEEGQKLSQVLGSLTMSSQASGEAFYLAQSLGIALDVATRLNATLNANAGIENGAPAARLGFGGGSTMDDPLANGMANMTLGFGNVTDAADETWRAVTDLTPAVVDLGGAMGGGTSGTGGAAESAEDLRKAFDDLMASMDPTIAAAQDMARDQKVIDDALAAGAITAEEYADALERIREEYSDPASSENPMADAILDFGDVFADFIETGAQDWAGFMEGLVDSTSAAVGKIIAELATIELAKAGGQIGSLAGPIGAVVGSLAGAAIGFGLGKIFNTDGTPKADAREDQRLGLEQQLWVLQGKNNKLREAEIMALDGQNRELGRKVQQMAIEAEIAAEREGLEQRLLQLQGKTGELKKIELAALDPSNRALLRRIWAIEKETAAADKAALRAEKKAAREEQREAEALAKAQGIADEREGLEKRILELNGDTAALRELELAEIHPSNRALQVHIWALEDEAAAAANAAGEVERLTAALTTNQFASLFEYERAVGLAKYGDMPAPNLAANSPIAPTSAATTAAVSGSAAAGPSNTDVLLTAILSKQTQQLGILRNWQGGGMPPERRRI